MAIFDEKQFLFGRFAKYEICEVCKVFEVDLQARFVRCARFTVCSDKSYLFGGTNVPYSKTFRVSGFQIPAREENP
jgi:hypothetical protein